VFSVPGFTMSRVKPRRKSVLGAPPSIIRTVVVLHLIPAP